MVSKILYLRKRYRFGPARITSYLHRFHGIDVARSTVHRITLDLREMAIFASQRIVRVALTTYVYTCTIRSMKLMSLPCYCATLRQTARAVTVLYEEMLAGSGLHATQYTALQLLDAAPNLTTTDLADALGIDQTTATRTLALIKKAGYASDTVGDDRRQRHWALQPGGKALLRKLKPRWEAAQEVFEKRLGRTQATALKEASYLAASRLSSA